ncbi:MAG: SDR family NAD(P)-dependent oxidoreductase [Pseudooceanicola sp.]
MDLTTTTAFVTGANRGIGRAIVSALIDAGAPRVYAASRKAGIEATDRIVPVTLDITDPDSVARAAARCPDVTLLVNNAGLVAGGPPLAEAALDGVRAEMETNVFGTLAMTRSFAPVIAGNGGGAVVALTSILALAPIPAVGTYAATKAALQSLVLSLRSELAPRGIRVMSVLPAFVHTDMTAGIEVDKMPADAVATALIDGLRGDTDDIFPGPAARMVEAYHADPAGYAARLAAPVARRAS